MDGLNTIINLRKIEAFAKTPIIVASASINTEDKKSFTEAGVSGFLLKPIVLPKLVKVLQQTLSLNWQFKEEVIASLEIDNQSIEIPPSDELHMLNKLSQVGSISRIQEWVERLENSNPIYEPFVSKIRILLDNFEIGEIQELAKRHLGKQSVED